MANEKRLIDANDLKKNKTVLWDEALGFSDCVLVEDIDNAPTVDAVEVVRCKDCKHGVWDEEEQMWKCVYSAEFDDDISEWLGFYEFNEGEHFCSRGERKDNDIRRP